jgi:hypothetical protein
MKTAQQIKGKILSYNDDLKDTLFELNDTYKEGFEDALKWVLEIE